jgi:hypothetical protein
MSCTPTWLAFLGVAACTLAACGKSEAPPAAPPAPGPAATAFRVADIQLGRGVDPMNRVTEPTTVFETTDVVYATVQTTGSAANVTLRAAWTHDDGALVAESMRMITPTGPLTTTFQAFRPRGWPVGRYRLEIFANGALAAKKDFEVAARKEPEVP